MNNIQPLAYSPDQAALRLGVSLRTIYYLISSKELPSLKIGKRRLVLEEECLRLFQRKIEESA